MITKEQAVDLGRFYGKEIYTTLEVDSTGRPQRWRTNGKCKTWKTRPKEFRLPLKYGLYAYGALTEANAEYFYMEEQDAIEALSPAQQARVGKRAKR